MSKHHWKHTKHFVRKHDSQLFILIAAAVLVFLLARGGIGQADNVFEAFGVMLGGLFSFVGTLIGGIFSFVFSLIGLVFGLIGTILGVIFSVVGLILSLVFGMLGVLVAVIIPLAIIAVLVKMATMASGHDRHWGEKAKRGAWPKRKRHDDDEIVIV